MLNRCDHISACITCRKLSRIWGVGDENNAGFFSTFGRGFILSGDCSGEEGCAIPLAPGEPSAEWRKKYSSLTATPFPPVMPQNICINKLPSPCAPIRSGQPDRQTPTRLLSVHLLWEHLVLPAPCSAAFVSEEAQSARGAQGGKEASLWLPRGADPRGSQPGPLGWVLSPPCWRGPATPSCSRDRRRLSQKCRSLFPHLSKTLEPSVGSGIKALSDLPQPGNRRCPSTISRSVQSWKARSCPRC